MSKRVCKFYARGSCLKGEQCDYSHDITDTPVEIPDSFTAFLHYILPINKLYVSFSLFSFSKKKQICTFYRKGLCSYGSRCRYKHVKASQAHSASSSANGHQSPPSNSVVARTARGKSSWVPKTTKLSPSDKRANSLHSSKLQDCPKNGAVDESSTAIPSEHIFCTFAAANCPLEEKCLRIHGDQCLYCRKYCLHPTEQRERENHLNTCEKKEKYLQALRDSQEIECNVCLERVLSKPTPAERKFGMFPECDHAFCLSCIKNWRSSAPNSGMDMTSTNTVRTCPVCRKLSYFVIPSPIWYSTKEEKQEIIDNYKAKCKLIDCKHFDFGKGNCPFGASCFYKHTVKPGSETWRRGRPPPSRITNNYFDEYDDMFDMLSEFDLESREFYSIMGDSEFFDDMDPFEMMAVSDMLASCSGPGFGPEDSNDELEYFQMSTLSEALDSDEAFAPEDSDGDELNPMAMEAALLSIMMHSNIAEEYSDEEY